MERVGRATRLRQGYVVPSIEGKVTRVGAVSVGSERVSIMKLEALDSTKTLRLDKVSLTYTVRS